MTQPENKEWAADRQLEEDLVLSWIHATSALKNTRITQKMIYNEAVVMAIVYERWREDGVGAVSFGEICRRTRMLKLLVNRTIGALVRRGFLLRRTGEETLARPGAAHHRAHRKGGCAHLLPHRRNGVQRRPPPRPRAERGTGRGTRRRITHLNDT